MIKRFKTVVTNYGLKLIFKFKSTILIKFMRENIVDDYGFVV